MSDDRLDKALESMRNENVNAEELARAHDRIWQKLGGQGKALCAEFRLQIRDYLDGQLDSSRQLLMEDHLGRCPACRAELALQKGGEKAAVVPLRRVSQWPRWGTWAAAAAVVLAALYFGRARIDTLLAPGGPRATVASVNGKLYRVPQGLLHPGETIAEGDVVRTGPASRALLRLADGSMVDVNEGTELSLRAKWSGKSVDLHRGDVIVQAAKQRRGYLQVQTRDSLVSVKGTVFAVSTGFAGSVVSVVEGSVAVAQAGSETLLSPGEQTASNPALTSSVEEAVSWSPDAETYLAMLASVAHIEKKLAALPSPMLRTDSSLLKLMPANTFIYGAIPNPGGTIDHALALAEQQSAENPAFQQWWNSAAGEGLKKLVGRIQTVTPLLGEEIVYAVCAGQSGTAQSVPIMLAEVRAGKSAELKAAMDSMTSGISEPPAYRLSETLLTASNSAANLQWLMDHAGEGAGTTFASDIAARYRDGAAWLLGIDMDTVLSLNGGAQNEFVRAQNVKHLFIEQRSVQGNEENELAVSFKGERTGLASILASTGSGGAAEYLSSDAIAALYASTREPQQLFEEFSALLSRSVPSFQTDLAQAEAKLGVNFANDFAAALGTEAAFSVEGLSATGPVWTMAALVHDPSVFETFVRRMADAFNTQLAEAGQPQQITIMTETAEGHAWTTMKASSTPLTITWTYDRGYLVAGSDRGAVLRALANRDGGSRLVWSSAFQQQMSPSAGLHPSGFIWLNTKGALEGIATFTQNPAIQKLIAERDPILVLLSGTTEQIRAVSRTRLSGMVVNMMLLQGIGRVHAESQTANP